MQPVDHAKPFKRRKLVDRSLPNVILQNPDFAEDSQMYESLLEMERKLDWTMTRKRLEIQDALSKAPTTTRTLRIFVNHTVSNQPWQEPKDPGDSTPAWTLKIEGRLLETANSKRDKNPPRKFSTFIKRMAVEFDRDPTLYPEGNIVEWPRSSHQNPILDGFEVKRQGDQPTKVRIVLYPEQYPEQFKVAPQLGNILGIKEESRTGIIQAVWNYIKIIGLQDKGDRRIIHSDERLRPLFGEVIQFHALPELVNRFLAPPDPVLLHYTLDPSQPPPERPTAWDIDIKIEDSSLKGRMTTVVQASKESAGRIAKLDEEIALLAQSLQNAHLKRTFLQSFASDPAAFVQQWLESQSRDLESILGSGPTEGLTVRQEELRRSEFFRLPWVEEAVAVQEGVRLAAKAMQ